MKKVPLIGITLDYRTDDEFSSYSSYPWYALRQHYSLVISKMGAIPVFLPFETYDNTNFDIKIIDGVIIPGGDFDVPPEYYNEKKLFDDVYPAKERCDSEVKIIKKALDVNMPLLGICHGMQLLNVYLGGSLYQNIFKQKESKINHQQKTSKYYTHHNLEIVKNTKLFSIVDNKNLFKINSYHRQSVKELGSGLKISGICPEDGVVEAIESENHDFVVGVEWHPEFLATKGLDDKLFKSFITATEDFMRRK